MKRKLTSKQHKFCECIVSGKNQTESYKYAYNAENMSDKVIEKRASELMKDGGITGGIEKLRKEVLEKIIYTVKDQFKELCKMKEKALKDGNLVTALKAIELKGKLFGLYVDKKEISGSLGIVKSFDLWKSRKVHKINNNKDNNE